MATICILSDAYIKGPHKTRLAELGIYLGNLYKTKKKCKEDVLSIAELISNYRNCVRTLCGVRTKGDERMGRERAAVSEPKASSAATAHSE